MFITTAPCGDARIFSLHETSSSTNLEAKNRPESEEKLSEENVELSQTVDNLVSDPNNNVIDELLENFGNDIVAVYVTKVSSSH